jgi:hypothetical protein
MISEVDIEAMRDDFEAADKVYGGMTLRRLATSDAACMSAIIAAGARDEWIGTPAASDATN